MFFEGMGCNFAVSCFAAMLQGRTLVRTLYLLLIPAQLRKCRVMNRLAALRHSPFVLRGTLHRWRSGGRCAAPGFGAALAALGWGFWQRVGGALRTKKSMPKHRFQINPKT